MRYLPSLIAIAAGMCLWRSHVGVMGAPINVPGLRPHSFAIDDSGNLYIGHTLFRHSRPVNTSVWRLTRWGTRKRLAGIGALGFSGDGGPATEARLASINDLLCDRDGNLYIADGGNRRVRKVSRGGVITTVAGSGPNFDNYDARRGYLSEAESRGEMSQSGDGSPAVTARIEWVAALAFDANGVLYVIDSIARKIRKIDNKGMITTAFDLRRYGAAGLWRSTYPNDLTVNRAGNLYFTDLNINRVGKLEGTGKLSWVAGSGSRGYGGDGQSATHALLDVPSHVAVDHRSNLYISDMRNRCIRQVNRAGIISTFAGNGTEGFSGDGGPAARSRLDTPHKLAFDRDGNLYVGDTDRYCVRRIDRAGIISTVIAPYGRFDNRHHLRR